jgi:hypothetical protein
LLKFQDQLLIAGHRSPRARIRIPVSRPPELAASISVMSREGKKFPRQRVF